MLAIRGLRKTYGDRVAVDGVDLTIGPGEVCALLGPNGAGKTTLVSAVAGLRRPDAGTVQVGGEAVWPDPRAAKALIGLAPQDLGVYPVLSARENLVLFGELSGLRGPALSAAIERVADALDLTRMLDRLIREMSGGEQRRVHTAMAMLHRPPLLLLDEPTTGVDVGTRNRLLDSVRRLAAEDGTAVCYSTHYLAEVPALDATVAIMDHGRLVARGPLASLVREHGSSAVEVVFDGPVPTIDGASVDGDRERLRMPTDDPASTIAHLLASLGPHAARVRSVEVQQADLESVFLAVTGRRYRADETEGAPV